MSQGIAAELRAAVEGFLPADTSARHWSLKDLAITTISSEQNHGRVEARFLVERWHTLDYARPEDVPAFRGRIRYLSENATLLTAVQLADAAVANGLWREELGEYITQTQYACDYIHALGRLDGEGQLVAESVTLYREDPLGRLLTVGADRVPSESEAEVIGFEAMKDICRSAVGGPQTAGVTASYDRLAARDYANAWTSNPTSGVCKGEIVECLQDDTKYNRTTYTTWYCCNDCVNYVSQAVKAGGIPTDSTWKPYTATWIDVDTLCNYMDATKNYWDTTTIGNCVAGYPLKITEHIMLMVYNDGTTRKYSAHTNDRLQVIWSGSATYYKVTY